MKLIASFVGMVALLVAITSSSMSVSADNQFMGKVYVCSGASAKCYHCYKGCKKLQHKEGTYVKLVALEDAQEDGYQPCDECY